MKTVKKLRLGLIAIVLIFGFGTNKALAWDVSTYVDGYLNNGYSGNGYGGYDDFQARSQYIHDRDVQRNLRQIPRRNIRQYPYDNSSYNSNCGCKKSKKNKKKCVSTQSYCRDRYTHSNSEFMNIYLQDYSDPSYYY